MLSNKLTACNYPLLTSRFVMTEGATGGRRKEEKWNQTPDSMHHSKSKSHACSPKLNWRRRLIGCSTTPNISVTQNKKYAIRNESRHNNAVTWSGTPATVVCGWLCCSDVRPLELVFSPVIFRWRKPVCSAAWSFRRAIVAFASASCSLRSSTDTGMVLATRWATCCRAPCFSVTARFSAEAVASPRFLLSGWLTAPMGSAVGRCGVTASGVGDRWDEAFSWVPTPLILGAGVVVITSSAGRKLTRIFFSWIDDLDVCSMLDQTDGILLNSLSPGTATDWTRNLSRHFWSNGGSSFIACSKTCTSTSEPGSIRPEFGLTQYCFGAVVFTLNATGSEWGLRIRRTWDTSCWNGPAWFVSNRRSRLLWFWQTDAWSQAPLARVPRTWWTIVVVSSVR